ncbi:glucan phosphoethanolaminetransferase (alkaline phosphatase superfamily) [Neisseria sp. HSC-16F19]|nr:hypothetical protein [Neisseria sp. HSC-16F19]MCP2041142.1 glucan phosphoethanolaminetransferase (alkaline phosphatase superfamily) [Neisseria sp. HSC-16F19]
MRKRHQAPPQTKPSAADVAIPSPAQQAVIDEQNKIPRPKVRRQLLVLAIPLVVVAITFFLGIVLMANGAPSQGSAMMTIAVVALLITTTGYIMVPSYIAAIIIYVILVKWRRLNPNKALWLIPFLQILFVWYPSYYQLPEDGRNTNVFLSLAGSALVITLIWIGLIRLVSWLWHKRKQRPKAHTH